jgi:hypothetical protein
MGLGKHEKADKGENGVWVGPFNTIPQAKKIASKILTDKGITKCEICLKTKNYASKMSIMWGFTK